ncbi:fibronectin type III domain-containing protein [Candidatus Peribacteria bacterium]|nr:fibronectin type III domain-containing protein [Candidatus Peribacteria bacterium]
MNVFYRWAGADSADAGAYSVSGTTPSVLATTNFNGLSHIKVSGSTLQVGAVYSAGNKGLRLSQISAVLTYTALVAPSALTATNSGVNIFVHWTDNTTVEDGFKVERSTDGGAYSQIDTVSVNVTGYMDTTVAANHSYSYRVRAYNSGGDSNYSGISIAYTLPAAPTGLTATASGATKIVLQWTDNAAYETQYKVERKTGTGGIFSQITTLAANTVTYTSTGSGGTTYTYRVRASNSAGNSGYSNEASATLP